MAAPRREPMLVRIMLYSPILQLKQLYSMDFLIHDRDAGELLVVLVICSFVNAT